MNGFFYLINPMYSVYPSSDFATFAALIIEEPPFVLWN